MRNQHLYASHNSSSNKMHKYGHDIVFAWHNNNNETEQPHYPTKIYIVIPDTASTSIGEYSFLSYIYFKSSGKLV